MGEVRPIRRLAVAAVLAAASVVSAASVFDAATAQRLVAAALEGRSLADARDLTETVGARVTGSRAYERAVAWAERRFKDAGVSSVRLERFSMARGWTRGAARGRIVAPVDQALSLAALGWTPSLGRDEIEAELVFAPDGGAVGAASVGGRLVLAEGGLPAGTESKLKAAGALGVLVADPDPDNLLTARMRHFGGDVSRLPVASVARDDAALLRRLLARGQVRVLIGWDNDITTGPVGIDSVVAEIAGRERPDEWVLVGAHLDSWDFATGAQDNATGVAMVIDAARAIAALGRPPRRSIRFALWGGEEQGLLGSAAYARAHAGELDRAMAVLNVDGGTGRVIGWTTPGREDVEARVRDLAKALLGGLDAAHIDHSLQYADDSDGAAFIQQGVPVLDMNVDDSRYEDIHHKNTDTMERVDAHNLSVGAAVAAVTAYAIADAPARFAPRLPRRP